MRVPSSSRLLRSVEPIEHCRLVLCARDGGEESVVHHVANEVHTVRDAFIAQVHQRRGVLVHPRTRKRLESFAASALLANGEQMCNIRLIEPLGYLDMVRLEHGARMILTDSGGVQKEAYWLGVPCVTLRNETEWVETVQAGWNVLAGHETAAIVAAGHDFAVPAVRNPLYGDGQAAPRIATAFDSPAVWMASARTVEVQGHDRPR